MTLKDKVTTESNCEECASQAGCDLEALPFVYEEDVKEAVKEFKKYLDSEPTSDDAKYYDVDSVFDKIFGDFK